MAVSLKINEDLIAIKKISQLFGEHKARVLAYIYNNAEDLKKYEIKKKKIKVKKEGEAGGKKESKEQKAK